MLFLGYDQLNYFYFPPVFFLPSTFAFLDLISSFEKLHLSSSYTSGEWHTLRFNVIGRFFVSIIIGRKTNASVFMVQVSTCVGIYYYFLLFLLRRFSIELMLQKNALLYFPVLLRRNIVFFFVWYGTLVCNCTNLKPLLMERQMLWTWNREHCMFYVILFQVIHLRWVVVYLTF